MFDLVCFFLQYVFALTTDVDGFDGGPLWRSDNYGAPNSWEDMTQKMTGGWGRDVALLWMMLLGGLHLLQTRRGTILEWAVGWTRYLSPWWLKTPVCSCCYCCTLPDVLM